MAAELKHGRRRTNSTAVSSPRNGHMRGVSRQVAVPKSSHTSDDFLQPFIQPTFEPSAFLNASLPPLQNQQQQRTATGGIQGSVPLAELSTQAQSLLSQLNAHTTRLSSTLTHLTDDILRSGSRLAYEVELLRGETLSFSETMNETLKDDIKKFVPEGLPQEPDLADDGERSKADTTETVKDGISEDDPEHIKQLQTLTLVRARLESVIKTFGDAMEFVFPPSELSVSSSFLSVSAPEPGSAQQSSEQKGQEVLRKLRDDIHTTLTKSEDPIQGIAQAAERIEELKELTKVWRGTAEEKGRAKFIESLAKMVEDRHRELMREVELANKRDEGVGRARKGSVTRDAGVVNAMEETKGGLGGFGLMSQLQKLRSGL
ncbi:hypothetical protein NLU13_4237 [Sarocladium strictum]|uniref:Uncharacterized protein n=1 Tax=Sarocladium strictum TaxID=5046 RepID=A0AA39L8G5_SARSR|nr:hypothetical protein NLU13_4237 [Sarocladium strictum]